MDTLIRTSDGADALVETIVNPLLAVSAIAILQENIGAVGIFSHRQGQALVVIAVEFDVRTTEIPLLSRRAQAVPKLYIGAIICTSLFGVKTLIGGVGRSDGMYLIGGRAGAGAVKKPLLVRCDSTIHKLDFRTVGDCFFAQRQAFFEILSGAEQARYPIVNPLLVLVAVAIP